MNIHHVSLIVSDLARSRRFYSEVLGLEEVDRPLSVFPGAWFACGTQQIHLLVLENPDPVSDRPLHVGRDRHTAFHVASIDGFISILKQKRIDYTTSESGRKAVFFRDPDGNGLELIAPMKSD